MNYPIAKRLIVAALILGLTLSLAGCYEEPGDDYVYFVDMSASVSMEDQPQLIAEIAKQSGSLKCGDAVAVYGLHSQTAASAPLYHETIPPNDHTIDGEMKCRNKLKQVRQDLKEKLHAALNSPERTFHTKIFDAIDRLSQLKRAGNRRMTVYFVGDLLQSDDRLDLEKVHITDDNIAELLNPVVADYGWQRGMLSGVKVHCLLISLKPDAKAPLNERRLLRKFWQTLFNALGGSLETFDTHIG
jgi:hypothetical protein